MGSMYLCVSKHGGVPPKKTTPGRPTTLIHPKRVTKLQDFHPGSPNEASQIELPENPRAPWKAIAEKKISRPILQLSVLCVSDRFKESKFQIFRNIKSVLWTNDLSDFTTELFCGVGSTKGIMEHIECTVSKLMDSHLLVTNIAKQHVDCIDMHIYVHARRATRIRIKYIIWSTYSINTTCWEIIIFCFWLLNNHETTEPTRHLSSPRCCLPFFKSLSTFKMLGRRHPTASSCL